MQMPSQASFRPGVGSLPAGRTGHACAQCRHRKHKCGGFTSDIRCRPCTVRKVKCSFQEEIMDLRHNPYLCMAAPSTGGPLPVGAEGAAAASINDSVRLSPGSAAMIPALAALDGGVDGQVAAGRTVTESSSSPRDSELPNQVHSLTSRIAELERRLNAAQHRSNEIQSHTRPLPSSHVDTQFRLSPQEAGPSHRGLPSPVLISPAVGLNESYSAAYSFSSSPGAVMTDGPLKTLNRFEADADKHAELELHDPIARPMLTQAEAHVIFKLFFSHCHPHAPFLDMDVDSDPDRVRSSSTLLFLAILSVGARFWSAPSRISCWLHPRYLELIRLLDAEIMRVTLRPRQEDHKLETVQALILYAHWMPLDISAYGEHYRSRFSEAGAWNCLGLAIRWATSIELEKSCYESFRQPETATRLDARGFRTMLYLTESDKYLALSARRPSCLNPEPLNQVLGNFSRCQHVQSTDKRLMSLFQVAHCAQLTDCQPMTTESVEAFDRYVRLVEGDFNSSHNRSGGAVDDAMSQHFPFTSLRWYRLSYTCAFLDNNTDQSHSRWARKALMWAVAWASQILLHLSMPLAGGLDPAVSDTRLNPDPGIVHVMSFTIDHYYVVISYAAFLLVNSWLRNFIDLNLQAITAHQQPEDVFGQEQDPCTSLLFRLVDVAAQTLEAASPPQGHLARRYVPLLRGMADMVASHNTKQQQQQQQQRNMDVDGGETAGGDRVAGDVTMSQTDQQLQTRLVEDIWGMWRQAGLEPINWPSMPDDLDLQGSNSL